MIVQAAGVADVIAAVNFARENDLMLAVRGGGHSVPGFGTCDDGLVLDLGRMNGMRVDPVGRTVRAEGGCTLGDLNHATHAFGLATPAGIVSTTGIAGLTLGGGMGYLSRAYGLSCDNLISADVVTANGDFVTCDAEREADLFWAIRGGGGNFGVVTSFEYRLHPVSHVLGGPIFYRIDGDVLRNYQRLMAEAPSELTVIFAFARGLPVPFLPEEWHDKPVMVTVTCWSGAKEKDDEITAMVAGLGEVLGQAHWRMPFRRSTPCSTSCYHGVSSTIGRLLSVGRSPRRPLRSIWNTDRRCQRWSRAPFSSPSMGPCHRVGVNDTAFAHRNSAYSLVLSGSWKEAAYNDQNIAWVRNYYDALRPYSDPGGYINFMSGDDQDRTPDNFGANYQRLREIKAKYDPGNLFRMNQNIVPTE